MKRLVLALLVTGGALAAAAAQEFPGNPSFKNPTDPAVRNLASLAGCWVGKNPWGAPTRITYDLASDSTVLVEYIEQQGQVPMYSAYYLDGETPMVHHFCSYGSQIRMKAKPSADPKVVHFEFFDATNVKSRDHDDHMTYVKFTFSDPDHVGIEWGLHQNRKDKQDRFTLTRVTEGCETRRTVVWH
jgi:hypothetical protein